MIIKQEIITVSVVSSGAGFMSKVNVRKYHIHRTKNNRIHAKLNKQFQFWNREGKRRMVVRRKKFDMDVDKVFE